MNTTDSSDNISFNPDKQCCISNVLW